MKYSIPHTIIKESNYITQIYTSNPDNSKWDYTIYDEPQDKCTLTTLGIDKVSSSVHIYVGYNPYNLSLDIEFVFDPQMLINEQMRLIVCNVLWDLTFKYYNPYRNEKLFQGYLEQCVHNVVCRLASIESEPGNFGQGV